MAASSARRLWAGLVVLIALVMAATSGCNRNDPARAYEQEKQAQEDAVNALKQRGAKLTELSNPQGKHWAIDLSGQQLSDEVFDQLGKVGYITELNLSKTNITDAHMDRVNAPAVGNLLRKLDLSHTAVTDAGLAKLDGLYILASLDLTGTKVTAAGVASYKTGRANNPKIHPLGKSLAIKF